MNHLEGVQVNENQSVAPEIDGFTAIGRGRNVIVREKAIVGPVRWVDSPAEVMKLIDGGETETSIVMSRGGTTTFVAPVLVTGCLGLITLQGAPESHLGILSREYGIPCIMGVEFTDGIQNSRGETIPADGTIVRLETSDPSVGYVLKAVEG